MFSLDMLTMSELYIKILQNSKIEILNFEKLIQIYKAFSKFSLVDLSYYFYKTKDENVLKYLKIKDITLNITGSDLLNKGYKQGVLFGEILDKLLEEKLHNPNLFKNKKSDHTILCTVLIFDFPTHPEFVHFLKIEI